MTKTKPEIKINQKLNTSIVNKINKMTKERNKVPKTLTKIRKATSKI